MFTGIVEELGEVVDLTRTPDAARLSVRGPRVLADAKDGDSIAVNGVCLTLAGRGDHTFTADVMAETLDRSSLGTLTPGSAVNLERAVPLGARLGGHLVQGHVDGTGTLVDRTPAAHWVLARIQLPADLARYVVEKGSVAVDGVSLTVTGVGEDWFTVGLIPTTLEQTTLGRLRPGQRLNIEVDILAKYVEKLLGDHR
jgi:riboflavin synthase